MKKFINILSIILIVALMVCVFVACDDNSDNNNNNNSGNTDDGVTQHIDYVAQLKLNLNSTTAKFQNVTVKTYVDGDTTHFYVDSSVIPGGVLKARYLAINTPESTGKIEPYGKKASDFTKSKLLNAVSIVLESDTTTWEPDSTGSRYLTWVWYKPTESSEYRNLNVEILQEGLAIASNTQNNSYGETAWAALQQAKTEKLNVHSPNADPDFYSGAAIPLTLKALRCNIADYTNISVAVEGIVARNSGNNGIYLESVDADPDTGLHYGIYCYYGFNNNALKILKVGNHVRVVGKVQYYEAGGTYQISGLKFDDGFSSDDPDNTVLIDNNTYTASHQAIDPAKFAEKTKLNVEFEINDEVSHADIEYPLLIMNSTVSLNGLKVVDVYTTTAEDSASKGAMTLTCTINGKTIDVRTTVLRDENNNVITASAYMGTTINVEGVVDYFDGNYQIKVFRTSDITVA